MSAKPTTIKTITIKRIPVTITPEELAEKSEKDRARELTTTRHIDIEVDYTDGSFGGRARGYYLRVGPDCKQGNATVFELGRGGSYALLETATRFNAKKLAAFAVALSDNSDVYQHMVENLMAKGFIQKSD